MLGFIRRTAVVLVALCLFMGGTGAFAQNLRDLAQVLDAAAGRVIVLDAQRRPVSSGSGYAVSVRGEGDDLYFLTNNHVVDGGVSVVVGYGEEDGIKLFEARLVNRSAAFDMALLRLTADDHDFVPRRLPLAGHEIAQGDGVFAIGFPGSADTLSRGLGDPAFFEPTLTQGIVSKRFEASWPTSTMRIDMVQHDAVINKGNSGGPLTSRCGVVVGLNTAGAIGGAQGTFWSSSAVAVSAFLGNAGVAPVTVDSVCDGNIVSGDGWLDRRTTLLVGGALIAAAILGGAVLLRSGDTPIPALRRPWGGRSAGGGGGGRSGASLVLARIGDTQFPLSAARLKRGVIIGRGDTAGLRIDSAALSREHAHLQLRDRKLYLQDLGSTNGTKVGGKPLDKGAPVQINTKSDISLGGLPFQLDRPGAR